MFDLTPFEELLRGHAGLLSDSPHDRWLRAQTLFEERAYREAAALLAELIDQMEPADDDTPDDTPVRHELTDARLLLARALFHSAQLDGAVRVASELLEHDPGEAYAHLIIGRALQRQGRRDEAERHVRLAEALGGYSA
jgi:Flp pilus assembly protein TadD